MSCVSWFWLKTFAISDSQYCFKIKKKKAIAHFDAVGAKISETLCVDVFLSRFHEAWDLCKSGGSPADWAELGKACLVHMEVELAIQIYRMCGNVGMVLSLQSIQVQVL